MDKDTKKYSAPRCAIRVDILVGSFDKVSVYNHFFVRFSQIYLRLKWSADIGKNSSEEFVVKEVFNLWKIILDGINFLRELSEISSLPFT